MKKKSIISIIVILSLINIFQFSWNQFGSKLFEYAVPTEESALEIGKIAFAGIDIKSFIVVESDNVWFVYGNPGGLRNISHLVIRKRDGRIIQMEKYEGETPSSYTESECPIQQALDRFQK